MVRRTKVINDPAELVPLLQTFGSEKHTRVFYEIFSDWRTEKELQDIIGRKDITKSLEILRNCGLLESRWRMPEPSKTPEKEHYSSYSKIRSNFQCSMEDLGGLIEIAFMDEKEIREIVDKIVEEVSKGTTSMVNLSRIMKQNPAFLRGVAKRSDKVTVKGQRVELPEK